MVEIVESWVKMIFIGLLPNTRAVKQEFRNIMHQQAVAGLCVCWLLQWSASAISLLMCFLQLQQQAHTMLLVRVLSLVLLVIFNLVLVI